MKSFLKSHFAIEMNLPVSKPLSQQTDLLFSRHLHLPKLEGDVFLFHHGAANPLGQDCRPRLSRSSSPLRTYDPAAAMVHGSLRNDSTLLAEGTAIPPSSAARHSTNNSYSADSIHSGFVQQLITNNLQSPKWRRFHQAGTIDRPMLNTSSQSAINRTFAGGAGGSREQLWAAARPSRQPSRSN